MHYVNAERFHYLRHFFDVVTQYEVKINLLLLFLHFISFFSLVGRLWLRMKYVQRVYYFLDPDLNKFKFDPPTHQESRD